MAFRFVVFVALASIASGTSACGLVGGVPALAGYGGLAGYGCGLGLPGVAGYGGLAGYGCGVGLPGVAVSGLGVGSLPSLGASNCGPAPSPLPVLQGAPLNYPTQESPLVHLPSPFIPAPRTIAHKCVCTKTVVKPQIVQRVINVPSVAKYLKKSYSPVVENIAYCAKPTCPEGPAVGACGAYPAVGAYAGVGACGVPAYAGVGACGVC